MKVLVLRFSAMGDVALTLPVIRDVLEQHPEMEITFVSRKFLAPIFNGIDRLHFYGVNTDNYKGFTGIWKLCLELDTAEGYDYLIDLHDSLRTKVMRSIFRLWKVKNKVIDKGKSEKHQLTRQKNKNLIPLKHATERYADVFRDAAIDIKTSLRSQPLMTSKKGKQGMEHFFSTIQASKFIGIAPFAAQQLKEWPLERFQELVSKLLNQQNDTHILLFGGKSDIVKLNALKGNNSRVQIVAGIEGGLETELAIIEKLELMICLDSGNMHLASLLGVKVLSLFGTTHPFLGFGPYLQPDNVVQINDLECRPCSVFGNTNCYRGDHACMQQITSDMVLNRIPLM